jgi:uncharacterized protein (TIGR02271 family)
MARSVVALYENFDTARQVVEELVDAGFDRSNISLVANDSSGKYSGYVNRTDANDDDVSAGEGAGFGAIVGGLIGLGVALIPGIGPVVAAGPLAAVLMGGIGAVAGAATGGVVAGLVDLGMSEEEAGYYAEGIRRGGTLVTLMVDRDEHVSRAEEIMNRYSPIDLDNRSEQWRTEGWTGYDVNAEPYTGSTMTSGMTSSASMAASGSSREVQPGEQVKMDVIEEDLQVGKRAVEGGKVRVRSVIEETPVQEDVTLREEHVTVERRPVDRPASEADINAFREKTVEVTERREEPIVRKEARVVEEVVIGKEVTEHTETVSDTVRRTDVQVEGAATTGMQSGTTYRPYTDYETSFRTHYNTTYGSSGYSWDQYNPAYRYGYTLATTDRYRDYDWDRLEPEARRYWDERNPNTWEQFKDSIRHAWNDVRNALS